jgi:hypothetical protein
MFCFNSFSEKSSWTSAYCTERKLLKNMLAGVRSSVLLLKDSVGRFSTSDFFHQWTPSRFLIYGLKPFRIWLRIRQDNRFENCQNQFFTFCQSSTLIFSVVDPKKIVSDPQHWFTVPAVPGTGSSQKKISWILLLINLTSLL